MKIRETFGSCLTALALAACHSGPSPVDRLSTGGRGSETVLFEDSMEKDWHKNWFLDGRKAKLRHRDGGLLFQSTSSGVSPENKNKYREKFDSHHAVLWTKEEFSGDIRISYEFTPIATSWANLLYIHARGIGVPPYVEDIHTWKDMREVASMDKYFNYMNLLSLSLRREIRCRRYPWNDVGRDMMRYDDNLVEPMVDHDGLEDGKTYRLVVDKREKSCTLRIQEIGSTEYLVDYTWDLSNPSAERRTPFVTKGRIGLRQMGGNEVIYRNFQVTRLPSG